MPARELVGLVWRLPRFQADEHWGYHQENTARLLEALSAWLTYEWASWTTDPEDPEFRRARAERRRSGIKPPSDPLIPPAALRPPVLADQRHQAYLADLARHEGRRDLRLVTSDEFDEILGL